ncbi:ATP-dependent DNA helicase pfh1-like [Chenopodium quinoa]|uniref:ATP-dependent DNA helicase pfh1-like n=1 Tax=Chenopodium quinoa TaxID=63459 RepID=UPI000B76E696|nr:ATP-dependent DNA helicase pfh1-like [Chenopodium quinoa]
MYPPVLPLSVHIPDMNIVCVRPYERLDVGIASGAYAKTPLTEFFCMNAATENGLGYLYGEFPEHYKWDASKKSWYKSQSKKPMIGQLAFVAPSEDLRIVKGYVYASFKEACLAAGILEEDDAASICLAEATEIQLPVALRHLFATVLIFCQPSNAEQLWYKYYSALSEDFARKYAGAERKIKKLTVRSVEQYLEAMRKSLGECGLAVLINNNDTEIDRTKDIQDALDAPIPQACIDRCSLLNSAQREIFTSIMQHIVEGKPGAFFVDGPGGTGKTFLYNVLHAEIRLMNKIVLPTATSGIATANIPSGRAAHSRFKIPVDNDDSLACSVSKQSSLAALIQETTLIIWDEASMANKQNIESLDLLLRDICDNDVLFGGKVIVFGGDFRQVLLVVPNKTQKEEVEASVVSSYIWHHLRRFRLTENLRAREDPSFSQFLLALGNGELQSKESDFIELPAQIVYTFEPDDNPMLLVLEDSFLELDSSALDHQIFSRRAVLTPINEDVDNINSFMIERFPGQAVTYTSYDTILDDTGSVCPTDFLNKLCPGGLSPHNLVLKENFPVILLRNLLPSSGLCNGTRLICKRFFPNLIECVISIGQHQGEHVFIPRIKLRPLSSHKYPFQFQRSQFPMKLSFAMTINKSQGQTLDQVLIYLPRSCFSHGQLYVALSRARSANKVKVILVAPIDQCPKNCVKKIVSYTVLKLAGVI